MGKADRLFDGSDAHELDPIDMGGQSNEELRNMLEDVVNELDLSDGIIEEHGPMGTAPSKLVRIILDRKDREISMLKQGFVCVCQK